MSTDLLEDYVQKIGDGILTEYEGDSFDLIACSHGDTVYEIFNPHDEVFSLIGYKFRAPEQFGKRLPEDTITELTEEEPHEGTLIGNSIPDDLMDDMSNEEEEMDGEWVFEQPENPEDLDPRIKAGREIIKEIDQEVIRRFEFNLFQELSNPEVSAQITRFGDEYFEGFTISRKVFPDDQGFSLTEFNKSVQAVVSLGIFGSNSILTMFERELEDVLEVDIE